MPPRRSLPFSLLLTPSHPSPLLSSYLCSFFSSLSSSSIRCPSLTPSLPPPPPAPRPSHPKYQDLAGYRGGVANHCKTPPAIMDHHRTSRATAEPSRGPAGRRWTTGQGTRIRQGVSGCEGGGGGQRGARIGVVTGGRRGTDPRRACAEPTATKSGF